MKIKISILILVIILVGISIFSTLGGSKESLDLEEGSIIINEVIPKNDSLYPDLNGEYYDLIELYNTTNKTIDLRGMSLSDDPKNPTKWTFESGQLKADEYLIVYAAGFNNEEQIGGSDYYTNFKLKADGEMVLLSDLSGDIISIVSYADLSGNMSLSKIEDEYVIILKGTPGMPNKGLIVEDIDEYNQKLELMASHESGIYKESIDLTFNEEEYYEIRYTLDGSDPQIDSLLYESRIELNDSNLNATKIANIQSTFNGVDKVRDDDINKATVVKARYFDGELPIGNPFIGTYFIWEDTEIDYSFDIVSLTTDPDNLYSPDDGIHVVGDIFEKQAPQNPDGSTPANYNQRGVEWEREANIEFFTSDGVKVYENGLGIRIFGGWSRANTKKSFKLFAKSEYGDSTFDYPFFDNMLDEKGELIDSFERLLLRTGGNDGEYALFRDPLADSLVDGMLDYQNYKQVILFLNGEYWGIYHLREHMDQNYLASHYDVDSEDVNIIAYNPDGLESYAGDEKELERFEEFMKFVDNNDISDANNYDYVKEMLDVESFMDYYITQIFINNVDWPANNAKVWRYSGDKSKLEIKDGKYRYLLYDTEFSFGLYTGASAAAHNYFEFLHEDTDAVWPNPTWSTLFYRNFMENEEFKDMFILKFTDLLNSRFNKDLVLNRIDEMTKLYKPEMEDYLNRWNFWAVKDVSSWEANQVGLLKEFSEKRGEYLRGFARFEYELGDINTVKVEPFKGGSIIINNSYKIRFEELRQETINQHVDSESPLFTMIKETDEVLYYYSDYMVNFVAQADEGYKFVSWEIETNASGGLDSIFESGDLTSEEITLNIEGDILIKAIYE